MSILSTTSSASVTAFTTPWIPPPNCSDHYITTTAVTGGSPPTTITTLASLPTNYPTCQPQGWHNDNPDDRLFLFSPAVCPSGWTAYHLGVGEAYNKHAHARRRFSYATCCSSGFTLEGISGVPEKRSGIVYDACVQEITTSLTSSPSGEFAVEATANTRGDREDGPPTNSATGVYTNGIRAHYPWIIRWEATDIGSLAPAPPDLGVTTQGVVLRTWVPGETVDPSSRVEPHQKSDDSGFNYGGLLAVIIVPTVVGGLIVIGCITFCVVRHKKHKKRRNQPQPQQPRPQERDPPVNILDPARTWTRRLVHFKGAAYSQHTFYLKSLAKMLDFCRFLDEYRQRLAGHRQRGHIDNL